MRKTIRLRGKAKGIFFLLRLDRIVPSRILHFMSGISDLSRWISRNKNCGFSDFYAFRFEYTKRTLLYEHVIDMMKLDKGLDYLEFGVAGGKSFNWWVDHLKSDEARFYGFDTFTGLPEDWGPFKKGDMNNGNSLPVINDPRCRFYQGLFQQTLIPFLKNFDAARPKVIHMDADLYSSTLYVLTQLSSYLKPGDIIFFDEFNVPMHEFRAFREWTESFYIKYRVIGGVNNFYQVAVVIE